MLEPERVRESRLHWQSFGRPISESLAQQKKVKRFRTLAAFRANFSCAPECGQPDTSKATTRKATTSVFRGVRVTISLSQRVYSRECIPSSVVHRAYLSTRVSLNERNERILTYSPTSTVHHEPCLSNCSDGVAVRRTAK